MNSLGSLQESSSSSHSGGGIDRSRLQVPGMFALSPSLRSANSVFQMAASPSMSPASSRPMDSSFMAPTPPPLSLNLSTSTMLSSSNGTDTPTMAGTPTAGASSTMAAAGKRKGTGMSDLSSEGGEFKLKHLVNRRLAVVKLDEANVSLKDFSLGATLGTGTFGRVNLIQQKTGKQSFFALKAMKKVDIVRLKQVDHIISEASLLKELAHPFIVNLCATMQDTRRLYLILEYVPGGELFSFLRRERRIPDEYARFYAAELVLALDYLHSRGIAYRDLKPENLLLSRTGHLKITDFGFAKKVDGRTWTLCGTPEYLAPEIIQSKGHGKGVDWWAMGILIYEMLAGYPPFYDDSSVLIYQKILRGNIEWPGFFDSRAQLLIAKLLKADVSQRLGCLRNGAEDVAQEPWFAKVNWQSVLDKLVSAPFFPPVSHPGDCSNFDEYDEEDEDKPVSTVKLEDQAQFALFGPYREEEDRLELVECRIPKRNPVSSPSPSPSTTSTTTTARSSTTSGSAAPTSSPMRPFHFSNGGSSSNGLGSNSKVSMMMHSSSPQKASQSVMYLRPHDI